MLSSSSSSSHYPKRREGFKQQQKLHARVAVVLLFLGMYVLVGPLVLHTFLTLELDASRTTELDMLAKRPLNANHDNNNNNNNNNNKKLSNDVLIVSLQNLGDIRITLRPEWSPESIDYIQRLLQNGHCQRCNLYRAEKPGILQGVMAAPAVPLAKIKGICPKGAETVHNECPPWDAECGCHGPVMQRGYVAWAAGKMGPDFFIDAYPKPAVWWGTQHTVWGEIEDVPSLQLIDEHIFSLPTHKQQGGLTMLEQPIHFDLSWEIV